MGLDNLFKLEKLQILAFKDKDRGDAWIPEGGTSNVLEVHYNPESFKVTYSNTYQPATQPGPKGEAAKPAQWLHAGVTNLVLKLIFDGTNVSHFGVELLFGLPSVADQVKQFLGLCFEPTPSTHAPPFLKLIWGQNTLFYRNEPFQCRVGNADVEYSLIDRDGSPLRADLTVTFISDPETTLRLSSPDVTHRRVVRAGDTLPLLCREIYGSTDHYLHVAAVNDLDDIRALQPGTELIFPPLERTRKRARK
jgi:nucleoid-associated protein YgaU